MGANYELTYDSTSLSIRQQGSQLLFGYFLYDNLHFAAFYVDDVFFT